VRKVLLSAVLMSSALFGIQPGSPGAAQEKTGGAAAAPPGAVKVKITTGGGLYGPPKSQYKVGEDIPVVISLTNTTDAPVKHCLSSSIFQNRPQLKRDGQIVPYVSGLIAQSEKTEFVQQCETSAARQFYELQPKDAHVVDWFTLSLGGVEWYAPLPAGRYELTLRRRIECCQGAFVESDKITFEVVP
jgi:hypothetical protein